MTTSTADQTILVADPDPAFQEAVRIVAREISVKCECYGTAAALLEACAAPRCGCLVVTIHLPDMDGAALADELARRGYWLPTVYVSPQADVSMAVDVMRRGAVTLLEKPARKAELLDAIRIALDEEQRQRALRTHVAEARCRLATLTSKERAVMELMVEGRANKAIATQLDVSVRTVEARRQRVFRKTHTNSIAELVRLVVTIPDKPATNSSGGRAW